MTLRFQPLPSQPYTFLDIKAKTQGLASSAAARACLFDPSSRMAVFAVLPLVATAARGGAGGAGAGTGPPELVHVCRAPACGSSPLGSMVCIKQPASAHKLWNPPCLLCACSGGGRQPTGWPSAGRALHLPGTLQWRHLQPLPGPAAVLLAGAPALAVAWH